VDVLAPEASAISLVDALAGHGVGLAVAAAEAGQPVQRPSDKRPASRRRAR
jgi:uroporphyrinogen III methyltransferase/synthase